MMLSLILILSVIFSFFSPSFAQDLSLFFKDLSPITAVVIGIDGKEVILDKGQQDGVVQGDIFSVYKLGEEIIHPLTKKVLGRHKKLVAKIQVKEVEKNFSTAIVLSKSESFNVGDIAIRYTDLNVLLIFQQIEGSKFLALFRNKLPKLTFRQIPNITFDNLSPVYLNEEKIDLVCVLNKNFLRLYDSKLDLLKVYNLQPSITQNLITTSIKKHSFQKIKKISRVIIDFEIGDVDNDGEVEAIYLTPYALFISKLNDSKTWNYEYKGFGKIFNFSLGPNGWIALNIYVDKKGFKSCLLRFESGKIKVVISHINFLLGFFDLDNDGIKETLLGQTFERGKIFGSGVYRLKIQGSKVVRVNREKVPLGFRLLGAAFADLDGDGIQEIIFEDLGRRLQIFKGNKRIWVSNQKVGGSIYVIKASVGISRTLYKLSINAEPDIYPLKINGKQGILVISNKSSHADIFPGIPRYSSGKVLFLTYTNTGYELLPLSPSLNGPIQGLGVIDKKIIVSLVNGNPFTQKGETIFLDLPITMRNY